MQAHGVRKRLTGPDGDNAGEPDGVGTAGVPAGRRPCRQQVQRLPSRQDLRSRTNINLPYPSIFEQVVLYLQCSPGRSSPSFQLLVMNPGFYLLHIGHFFYCSSVCFVVISIS